MNTLHIFIVSAVLSLGSLYISVQKTLDTRDELFQNVNEISRQLTIVKEDFKSLKITQNDFIKERTNELEDQLAERIGTLEHSVDKLKFITGQK